MDHVNGKVPSEWSGRRIRVMSGYGMSEWPTDKQAMEKILVAGVRRGVAWSYPEFVIASVER